MPKQTIDVLMGGYLSKDAAREDFDAVQACGADLIGLVVVSKDLDGTVRSTSRTTRPQGGARSSAGRASSSVCSRRHSSSPPPSGRSSGPGVGKIAHRKIESASRSRPRRPSRSVAPG